MLAIFGLGSNYDDQAVLFARDVETLSPGNHEKVTGNFNENPRVIKLDIRAHQWHVNFLAKDALSQETISCGRKPFPVKFSVIGQHPCHRKTPSQAKIPVKGKYFHFKSIM